MNFSLSKSKLLLVSVLIISLVAFVGCGEDDEVDDVSTSDDVYDISGQIEDYDGDMSNVSVYAAGTTTTPDSDGKWSISDVAKGSKVSVAVEDVATQNISFEPESHTVDGEDGFVFRALTGDYHGYSEDIKFEDGETVVSLTFDDDLISPAKSYDALKDAMELSTGDDFDVNFILEENERPDEDSHGGPDEGWEHIDTIDNVKVLEVIIQGRVADEIVVKIAEDTFKNEAGGLIRAIETKPLALSDDTTIEEDGSSVVERVNNNEQVVEVYDDSNDNLMPVAEAVFDDLDTTADGAEIIVIAGEEVEKIIEADSGHELEDGNVLKVRAENGEITEYTIELRSDSKDTSVAFEHDVHGQDYFEVVTDEEDEEVDKIIQSGITRLHWNLDISEFEDGLVINNESDKVLVYAEDVNYDNLNDTKRAFDDLDDEGYDLFNDAHEDSEDTFDENEEYKLVVQAENGDVEIYDVAVEAPRDIIELESLDAEEIEVYNVENDTRTIWLRSDLDGALDSAENLLTAVEGGEITAHDDGDDTITVAAEDENITADYNVKYRPGFMNAAVDNTNPYKVTVEFSGISDSEADWNFESCPQYPFEVEVIEGTIEDKDITVDEVNPNFNDDEIELILDTRIIEGDELRVKYDADNECVRYDGEKLFDFDREVENQVKAHEYVRIVRAIRAPSSDESGDAETIRIEFDGPAGLATEGNVEELFTIQASMNDYDDLVGEEAPQVENVVVDTDNNNIIDLELDREVLAEESITVEYEVDPYTYDARLYADVAYTDTAEENNYDKSVLAWDFEADVCSDIEAAPFVESATTSGANTIELTFDDEVTTNPELVDTDNLSELFEIVGDSIHDYRNDYDEEDDEYEYEGLEVVEIEPVEDSTTVELALDHEIAHEREQSELEVSYNPQLRERDEDGNVKDVPAGFLVDAEYGNKVFAQNVAANNTIETAEIDGAEVFIAEGAEEECSNQIDLFFDKAIATPPSTDSLSVEGEETYEVTNIEIRSDEDEDDTIVRLDLDNGVKYEENIEVSYNYYQDASLETEDDNYPVYNFAQEVDNELKALRIVEAEVTEFYPRDEIVVSFNRNLTDLPDDLFDGGESNSIQNNFIVDGELEASNVVTERDGYDLDDNQLIVVVDGRVDDEELEISYRKNVSNENLYDVIEDDCGNYLVESETEIELGFEYPEFTAYIENQDSGAEYGATPTINYEITGETGTIAHSDLTITIDGEDYVIDAGEDFEAEESIEHDVDDNEAVIEEGEDFEVSGTFITSEYEFNAEDGELDNNIRGPRVLEDNSDHSLEHSQGEIEVDVEFDMELALNPADEANENIDELADHLEANHDFEVSSIDNYDLAILDGSFDSFLENVSFELNRVLLPGEDIEVEYINRQKIADEYHNVAARDYEGRTISLSSDSQYSEITAELSDDLEEINEDNISGEEDEEETEFTVEMTGDVEFDSLLREEIGGELDTDDNDDISPEDISEMIAVSGTELDVSRIQIETDEITFTLDGEVTKDMGTLRVHYTPQADNKLVNTSHDEVIRPFSRDITNAID